MQQRRHNQHFSVMHRHRTDKPAVATKLPQIPQSIMIDAKSMFEAGMSRPGVDAGRQCQLSNMAEPLKFGRVHNGPHPRRKRDVLLHWNPQNANRRACLSQFRDV